MPHPRKHDNDMEHLRKDKHFIPLEDWADYIEGLPELSPEEMTMQELTALADKLKVRLDQINDIIEERAKEESE